MISLDEWSGSWNALSPKIWVPTKTIYINVKTLNLITNKNVPKTRAKHISCGCKCKFNSTI